MLKHTLKLLFLILENIMITLQRITYSFFFSLALISFLFSSQIIASPSGGAKPLTNSTTSSSEANLPQTRLSVQEPDGFNDFYNKYASKKNYKALYIAVDGLDYDGWAAGYGSDYATLAEAKARALDECEGSRLDWNIISSCVLYAENDRVVYYDNFINQDATINDALDIHIPSIDLGGTDLEVDLILSHMSNGNYFWRLSGVAASNFYANNGTISTTTLRISINSIIYASYYDFWLVLDYAYEKNGVHYWALNSIGSNN